MPALQDATPVILADPSDVEKVWTGIALHITPGITEFMHPAIALTAADLDMGVLGLTYDQCAGEVGEAVMPPSSAPNSARRPSSRRLRRHQAQAAHGLLQREADVIADREPHFHRGNFCSVIRGSHGEA